MSRSHRLPSRYLQARLPRWTLRLRLTTLYGGVFIISGLVLLGLTYALVARSTDNAILFRPLARGSTERSATFSRRITSGKSAFPVPGRERAQTNRLLAQLAHQHASDLHQLLTQSAIALAGMAFLSLALGWLLAGRALRPVRTMTAAARRITARNLHERLGVRGPADELKDLGDTIDELLGRLEAAFEAQRRFVANASHELRTPLTLGRALLEDHLAAPDASLDSFRATSERLLAIGEQQEHLIEALLMLASSERGLEHREPVELATVADEIVHLRRLGRSTLHVCTSLSAARVSGDARLIQRLIANLVDNAVRYNLPDGHVDITTGTESGHGFVSVANSGPAVPPHELERLFQPFQRLATGRTSAAEGHGLGLSIVHAIANAHDASLAAHARPDGGLAVRVDFPAVLKA